MSNLDYEKALPVRRRVILRLVRNLVVLAIAAGIMLERYGFPHILTTYTYDDHNAARRYRACRYWSVTGFRECAPGRFGVGAMIVFLPLDKSVLHYVKQGDACSGSVSHRQLKSMNEDTKARSIDQLHGELGEAFRPAAEGTNPASVRLNASRGSNMVKADSFGLDEGPPPPGMARMAVTRQTFNRRWREESRVSEGCARN